MNMKKIYIAMLLAAFTLAGAHAQDNTKLNKEITLEKDIAPLEKKAVKKNELPKVKKPTTTGTKTQLNYSDLTSPIEVPTTIPTLLPYGYRTAHNFSDKRGYLDVGGGTQANFKVSFGYRFIDEEREKLRRKYGLTEKELATELEEINGVWQAPEEEEEKDDANQVD